MSLRIASRSASAAFALALVLSGASARAEGVRHVALSAPPGAAVTDHLRAELGLKGFRVTTYGAAPNGCFGAEWKRMAADADAAVCVDTDSEIFVRKDGALVHTDTVSSVEAADIAAIRSAEIVRVRLDTMNAPLPGPTPAAEAPVANPPEDDAKAVTATTKPATERDHATPGASAESTNGLSHLHFGVTGGVLMDGASATKPLYPTAGVSLTYRYDKPLNVDLVGSVTAFYIGDEQRFGGGYGAVSTRFQLFQLGDFRATLGPSLGAMYLALDPSNPRLFAYASADSSLQLAVTDRMSVALEGGVGIVFDQDDTDVKNPMTAALRGNWAF